MHLGIVGPDGEPLPVRDLRRLFPAGGLSAERRDRVTHCARVTATYHGRVVGLATYLKIDAELRVPDLAIDSHAPCATRAVVGTILHGLELACLAGGARRIVMRPSPAIPSAVFRSRGYVTAQRHHEAGWISKRMG